MSTVLTTTRTPPALNTALLARLAERWRPAGLHLACLGRDGSLLWHDAQMPRLLALCVTLDPALPAHLRRLPENAALSPSAVLTPLPGVQAHLLPVVRRRKTSAYLVVLVRTQQVPLSEELQRLAGRAALDAASLQAQCLKSPAVAPAQAPALATLVLEMYEDLNGTALRETELSGVTEQLSSVYEEISLLYKISSGMRFSQKPQAFLETVCGEVQELGSFRAVAVAFAHREDEQSELTVGDLAVVVGECPVGGQELVNALHAPIHEALRLGETRVFNDLDGASDFARLRHAMQRFVCVPLIRDQRPLGVMLAIDKLDQGEFTSVDLKLLNNVGSQCSIFLENAQLYQDMQGLFMGVLHALTRSIDAKDAYTRGHSQRVAALSRALAHQIGLADEQCERIYLSGLLHDVGKIGVPEAVLTKPGRLSDAEFEAIKKHPAIGAQILGNIKQLQDIIPGVLYHHERWDGRGYPYNLASDSIPLMGRIICVADSFDAMSSTRTYRPALPLETVLAELNRCAGTQFDPELARVFVTLDFRQYQQAVEEHLMMPRTAEVLA
jgi:HD-GYP domain-containing protein (c-di-GMP phosphodiesterase class II)